MPLIQHCMKTRQCWNWIRNVLPHSNHNHLHLVCYSYVICVHSQRIQPIPNLNLEPPPNWTAFKVPSRGDIDYGAPSDLGHWDFKSNPRRPGPKPADRVQCIRPMCTWVWPGECRAVTSYDVIPFNGGNWDWNTHFNITCILFTSPTIQAATLLPPWVASTCTLPCLDAIKIAPDLSQNKSLP